MSCGTDIEWALRSGQARLGPIQGKAAKAHQSEYVLDISAERGDDRGGVEGDRLGSPTTARVSFFMALSSPLHVRVLAIPVVGWENEPRLDGHMASFLAVFAPWVSMNM